MASDKADCVPTVTLGNQFLSTWVISRGDLNCIIFIFIYFQIHAILKYTPFKKIAPNKAYSFHRLTIYPREKVDFTM